LFGNVVAHATPHTITFFSEREREKKIATAKRKKMKISFLL
jgi:hypothetical protein